MDAVGFEPTIIGTLRLWIGYLTNISMNYTEPYQHTLHLIECIIYTVEEQKVMIAKPRET